MSIIGFSKRKALEDAYKKWCAKEKVSDSPFSVITFLTGYGLLDSHAVDEYLDKTSNINMFDLPKEHGRLIDADALIDDLRHSLFGYARMNGHFRDECNCRILIEMLERAETVLPKEE